MNNNDLQMTYEMFSKNILAIKTLSDKIKDNWDLEGNMDEEYKSYLKKINLYFFDGTQGLTKYTHEYFEAYDNSLIVFEHHVTYSISYGVPLLCLKITDLDGNRFSKEKAWKYFDEHYAQEDMNSVLTEQDHAVLQTPFFVLHPCKTAELLENISLKSENPVVSWLSTVGPAVKMHLSNAYEKLTRKI